MKNIDQIIRDYTTGEAGLEDTNSALARAKAGFRFEPSRNALTETDRRETVVGYYPEQASGWGLLDTGTGSMEKVKVTNGKLGFAVNQVQPDGGTNSYAYVVICGKTYEVLGDTLAEPRQAEEVPKVQKDIDWSRRTDLAGQQAEQKCRKGRFLVTYDELGCAVKATRL